LTRTAIERELLMIITTAVTPKHTLQNQFQLLKFMMNEYTTQVHRAAINKIKI